MSVVEGNKINRDVLDKALLTGPGEYLVLSLINQLIKVPGFRELYGDFSDDDLCRWATYQRRDWSIRMLPVINIFESSTEEKSSDEGWVVGTLQIQAFWPESLRRRDLTAVPVAFKGAIQNFFSSRYARELLDEHYSIERENKVPGLNELGKTIVWSPQTEGIVADTAVPVTILDVRYRIDLRAWYRHLENVEGRTKDEPFKSTLVDLTGTTGDIVGLDKENDVQIEVPANFNVSNP